MFRSKIKKTTQRRSSSPDCIDETPSKKKKLTYDDNNDKSDCNMSFTTSVTSTPKVTKNVNKKYSFVPVTRVPDVLPSTSKSNDSKLNDSKSKEDKKTLSSIFANIDLEYDLDNFNLKDSFQSALKVVKTNVNSDENNSQILSSENTEILSLSSLSSPSSMKTKIETKMETKMEMEMEVQMEMERKTPENVRKFDSGIGDSIVINDSCATNDFIIDDNDNKSNFSDSLNDELFANIIYNDNNNNDTSDSSLKENIFADVSIINNDNNSSDNNINNNINNNIDNNIDNYNDDDYNVDEEFPINSSDDELFSKVNIQDQRDNDYADDEDYLSSSDDELFLSFAKSFEEQERKKQQTNQNKSIAYL